MQQPLPTPQPLPGDNAADGSHRLVGVHGGPDAQGVPVHDFSTNSNACGPCPEALAALQQADATRYPDPAYTALRAALAALHGVAPGRIVVAGSASEFIHRITTWARLQGAAQVLLPPHSYGDYAQAAQAHGLALRRRGAGGGAGTDGAGDASITLHWACEPASPLGTVDAVLAAWHADPTLETPGSLRVLDCAYRPLVLESADAFSAVPPALPASAWQLWSPNKALGLTGVRAAYAVAPAGAEGTVLALQALASSWPVGAHGVALLHAWATPAVQQWVAACLPTLREWKARQQALCAALGWAVAPGSLANYFVATLPISGVSTAETALGHGLPAVNPAVRAEPVEAWARTGTTGRCGLGPAHPAIPVLLAALRQHGIKLRDCASFGLPGAVRLGVLPPASQDALQAAWHAIQALQAVQAGWFPFNENECTDECPRK